MDGKPIPKIYSPHAEPPTTEATTTDAMTTEPTVQTPGQCVSKLWYVYNVYI